MTGTWGDGVWGDGVWGKGPLSTWIPADNEPVGLSATVLAGPKVRLAWTEGGTEQEGDGFKVYRSANGGADQLMDTVALDVLQWDDESVSVGNKYAYTVYEYKDVYLSDGASVAALLPLHEESVGVSASKLNSVERPVVAEVGMSATTPRIASRSLPSEWTDLCDGDRRDILRSFDSLGIGMAPSRSHVWGLLRKHSEAQGLSDGHTVAGYRTVSLSMPVSGDVTRDLIMRAAPESVLVSELHGRIWQAAREWIDELGMAAVAMRGALRDLYETVAVVVLAGKGASRDLIGLLEIDGSMLRTVSWKRGFLEDIEALDGDRHDVEREWYEELGMQAIASRDSIRDLAEVMSIFVDDYHGLVHALIEDLDVDEESSKAWSVRRVWPESLPVSAVRFRTWQVVRTKRDAILVLSRLATPQGSTGYPWDVPPFETRAGTMRLRRNGALWILNRTPVTGRLKREATLSSRGGGA